MEQTTPVKNNRAVLLLIGGIPVTMILAATWLWFFVASGDLDLVQALGTANRGTLVEPPRQLDDRDLTDDTALPAKFADLDPPRWAFLVPGDGASCDAQCEKTLYTTRQIHIALGKEFNRVRRLYVGTDALADTRLGVSELSDGAPAPASFADYLDTEHRGLNAFTVSDADFAALFPEYAENDSTWYLVDPKGWIMMSYNGEIPYKDVISDLKFLLKN